MDKTDYRTPEWQEPKCFEGHLNEEQLVQLERQDAKRDVKTALMLSQLSQAVDFCIGWSKLLVGSVRHGEHNQFEMEKRQDTVDLRIDRLEQKLKVAQWIAGIVGAALLVEVVRGWFR